MAYGKIKRTFLNRTKKLAGHRSSCHTCSKAPSPCPAVCLLQRCLTDTHPSYPALFSFKRRRADNARERIIVNSRSPQRHGQQQEGRLVYSEPRDGKTAAREHSRKGVITCETMGEIFCHNVSVFSGMTPIRPPSLGKPGVNASARSCVSFSRLLKVWSASGTSADPKEATECLLAAEVRAR